VDYSKDHAEVYDLVFAGRGKNFGKEAERLANMVWSRCPDAASLLDVACGTGAHLEVLKEQFKDIEGVELAPAMLDVARRRLPDVALHEGDMRTFALGRAFDAVICVGNSVACLKSTADLDRAVARMAAHLAPGGVLVVEPWFFSGEFLDGRVDGSLHKQDGRVVSQMTRFTVDGNVIRMQARFAVVDAEGFHDFTEELTASAFTRADYLTAFEGAGLTPKFVRGFTFEDGRPTAPGLFVGMW
jgi:SAM-dependent methyltransferase